MTMVGRRRFLQLSALAAAAGLVRPALAKTSAATPVIVSTWDFGVSANAPGWQRLADGGSALDAVEAAARLAERDSGGVTVGYGGYPDREGRVTLDAAIMDGAGNYGAVAALEDVLHAVSVARRVMEATPHVLLVGEGARQFALAQGFPTQSLLTDEATAAWRKWLETSDYRPRANIENLRRDEPPPPARLDNGDVNHDTLGVLALDAQGRLAGACTTSGMAFKMHGRVGDSPIAGAGLFVDDEAGAATASGHGEEMLRTAASHTVVELMRQGASPGEACRRAVQRIRAKRPRNRMDGAQACLLAIGRDGTVGACSLLPGFTYAVTTRDGTHLLKAPSLA